MASSKLVFPHKLIKFASPLVDIFFSISEHTSVSFTEPNTMTLLFLPKKYLPTSA